MAQETTDSAAVPREMTVAGWLFNPFIRVAGGQALAVGLTVIVTSGLAAAAGGLHFDGLLDAHVGAIRLRLWVPVAEGLLNWLVITTLLGLASLLFAPPTVRLVDIAGTQALARWPLLVPALVCALPWVRRAVAASAGDGEGTALPAWGIVAACSMVIGGVWMIWLMWKAFAVVFNMRGGPAFAVFAAAVVIGEVVTKLLVLGMLNRMAIAATTVGTGALAGG